MITCNILRLGLILIHILPNRIYIAPRLFAPEMFKCNKGVEDLYEFAYTPIKCHVYTLVEIIFALFVQYETRKKP